MINQLPVVPGRGATDFNLPVTCASVHAQRAERVQPGGAPCRHQAGEHRHGQQRRAHQGEHAAIDGLGSIEHASDGPRSCQTRHQSQQPRASGRACALRSVHRAAATRRGSNSRSSEPARGSAPGCRRHGVLPSAHPLDSCPRPDSHRSGVRDVRVVHRSDAQPHCFGRTASRSASSVAQAIAWTPLHPSATIKPIAEGRFPFAVSAASYLRPQGGERISLRLPTVSLLAHLALLPPR